MSCTIRTGRLITEVRDGRHSRVVESVADSEDCERKLHCGREYVIDSINPQSVGTSVANTRDQDEDTKGAKVK